MIRVLTLSISVVSFLLALSFFYRYLHTGIVNAHTIIVKYLPICGELLVVNLSPEEFESLGFAKAHHRRAYPKRRTLITI
ncbi:MAG TPA: hypothetical protein VKA87_02170 [Nitrososphaeraceae archaeon]|nr:hypothetical protein [Nitrososphaeraceae archaeon]